MATNKALSLLTCQETLLADICNGIGIKGKFVTNNFGVELYTLFVNDKELPWDEFADYIFPKPFAITNDEIVGAIVFGDGTLEFLLRGDDEPVAWNDLNEVDLIKLVEYVEEITK